MFGENASKSNKYQVNWRAIVLKIHESLVEHNKSFEVLTNLVKQPSATQSLVFNIILC